MSDDHDSDSHSVLVAKCAAMACLFCATILFGTIPFMLNYWLKWTDNKPNSRSAKIVQYLLYFGGGVLLATTFIHLLPEVQEVVENLQESGKLAETRFALAEVLMCTGFILMYFIEECLHKYLHREKKEVLAKDDGVGAAFERGHSVRNSILVRGSKRSRAPTQSTTACPAAQPAESCEDLPCENKNYLSSTLTVDHLIESSCGNHADMQVQVDSCHDSKNDNHHHHHHHHGHGHSHLPLQSNSSDGVVTSSLRGLGIVLGLSLHEIFEGMAIGLEHSADSVWFLFGAVSAHKLVLAFCVGVELIVARTRPALAAVYTITFAIVSPIGIGVGILVSHNSSASEDSIVSAILQGIACGTLLYVVFFEILSTKHTGFGAFIAMVVGFALMFGLQNIGEGGHGHSHGHSHGDPSSHAPDSESTTSATKSHG